jgi:WD40 repeat protein
VPERQVLDETARAALQQAAEGAADVLRIREQRTGPGIRRFGPGRRTIVLGGLAAITAAAVPAALDLSRPAATGPDIIYAYRVLPGDVRVLAVTWDPHRGTLTSSGADGYIRLWDTATETATAIHATTKGWAIAYSPREVDLLASGDGHHPVVRLWDTATWHAATLPGQTGMVFSVAFSPDGKTLASVGPVGWVEAWDVASKDRIASYRVLSLPNSVAFSQDGQTLALGCEDGTVQLRDLRTGALLTVLKGHTGWVGSVAYSPDWATLASGGQDKTVRLWDLTAGRAIAVLHGHTSWVQSVAFSPDGKTLASGSNDSTIRLWDHTTKKTTAICRGHTSWVESVAFSPDGKTLASGSDDNTIRLWKVP